MRLCGDAPGHRGGNVGTLVIDKVLDKVFDKTDKGREEIATRKYRVPPRLRTLLVMIDGRRSLDELMTNFAALGVTEETFTELLERDLIALAGAGADATIGMPPRQKASTRIAGADIDHNAVPMQRLATPVPAAVPATVTAALPAGTVAPDKMADADRFRALAAFYNQTIKSTIGLRGIMLQLRAEKCACVEDFRAMRLVFLEAVYKAKGREMAVSLRDRLDQLLGGKPATDPFHPE